jgi:hypothetical protein
MGSMPETPRLVKPIGIWPINLLTPLFPEIPIIGFFISGNPYYWIFIS